MWEAVFELGAIAILGYVVYATFEPQRARIFKKPRSDRFFVCLRIAAIVAIVGCLSRMVFVLQPKDNSKDDTGESAEYRQAEEKFSRIQKGMTKADVLAILGKPTHPEITYVYGKDDALLEMFLGPPDDPDLKRRFPNNEKQVRLKWVIRDVGEYLVVFNMQDTVERKMSSAFRAFALPRD